MKRFSTAVVLALTMPLGALLGAPQHREPARFESKVNVVIVPVLVLDRHGRAIGGLNQEDFQVFDQGKRQVISRFTIQTRAGESTAGKISPDAEPASDPRLEVNAIPHRCIVFLFDDLHLNSGEMDGVRRAGSQMIAGSLQSTDSAAVISTSARVNTGFTRDRTKLEDAISKLRAQPLYHRQDCPDLDHYEAYMIHDLQDPTALEDGAAKAVRCFPGIPPEMAEGLARSAATAEMSIGELGTRATLEVIRQVIRQMGPLPGQHTLVLISSGFIAFTPEAARAKGQVLDIAAQANVTVSTLDARGLYTFTTDASKQWETRAEVDVRRDSLATYGSVMAELASGTGGTYLHDSNDLKGGFERLTKAPEYLYLLEFSPRSVKSDGSYHQLRVKVAAKGVRIQARHGYLADQPEGAENRNRARQSQ